MPAVGEQLLVLLRIIAIMPIDHHNSTVSVTRARACVSVNKVTHAWPAGAWVLSSLVAIFARKCSCHNDIFFRLDFFSQEKPRWRLLQLVQYLTPAY